MRRRIGRRADPAPAGRRPDGAELFATTCQVCHGQAGIGGVGPALRGAKFTADYVRKVLQDGRPGTMMPGFTGTMSAAEIADVTRYVVRLQAPDGPAPGGLRGDPNAGQAVFFMKGSARSCSVCHSVEGRGGSVGPDLMSKIAGQSPKQIFQKIIVVPHRSADPAYSTVRLTTKTGAILTGIRSGETKDAVLFYDTSSLPPILRTIPKSRHHRLGAAAEQRDAERLRVAPHPPATPRRRGVPADGERRPQRRGDPRRRRGLGAGPDRDILAARPHDGPARQPPGAPMQAWSQ